MFYSLRDQLLLCQAKPLEDKEAARLRGQGWLTQAINSSGLDPRAFTRKYIDRGRSFSGLAAKWQSGKVCPTRLSAVGVEKVLPGALWVFDLELWRLLSNTPIKTSDVKRIIAQYSDGVFWKFPSNLGSRPCRNSVIARIHDTQRLVYRGDLWGFIGALALTRLYESTGECLLHYGASMDMFRALPGALKEPWSRPLAKDLLRQLHLIKGRNPLSAVMYEVDEEVVIRQADDAAFEPHREWRHRDPETLRFIEIEDPVLHSSIVPSKSVQS